jgi:hypothetical protein
LLDGQAYFEEGNGNEHTATNRNLVICKNFGKIWLFVFIPKSIVIKYESAVYMVDKKKPLFLQAFIGICIYMKGVYENDTFMSA